MSMDSVPYWRAIACDLDGTLIGYDHKANDRDFDALRRARDAGIHVALATGRNSRECAGPIAALGLSGAGVFVNGAMICDMATGKSLSCRHMTYDLALEIMDFFGSRGHAVLVLADHPETGQPIYFRADHGPPHRATVEWLLANRMEATIVDDIPRAFRRHVIRLGIVVDVQSSPPLERALAEQFGTRVSSHSIYSPYFDCQIIEVYCEVTSKWTGIEKMCEMMQIPADRVIAIGDDINDIAMLQRASLSFAMGSASPVIRKFATRVTASQSECGVAQVIDALLAGHLHS